MSRDCIMFCFVKYLYTTLFCYDTGWMSWAKDFTIVNIMFCFVKYLMHYTFSWGHYLLLLYPECGGDLTTPTGTFTSPSYPNMYAHHRRCTWRITVERDRRVTLAFNDFQLEQNEGCHYDSVEVYTFILIINSYFFVFYNDIVYNIVNYSVDSVKKKQIGLVKMTYITCK